MPQAPSGLLFLRAAARPRAARRPKEKTARRVAPAGRRVIGDRLHRLPNVGGLKPLRPFRHFEFHLVALGQTLEPLSLNGAVVDEDIFPALDLDEAIPLRIV